MYRYLRWLNPLLTRFGYKIIEEHMGRWSVRDGKLHCVSIPLDYWRLAGPGEWEGLPANATCLARMMGKVKHGHADLSDQN